MVERSRWPGKWGTSFFEGLKTARSDLLVPEDSRVPEPRKEKGIKRRADMATTIQPVTEQAAKQLVNYRVDGGVAVIEMNDPPANTYTYEMNRQLDDAILKARMDNDAYVILLTGAGDKFFSAGANIKMLASVDPTFKYYFCLHANEMLLPLEHTPKL